MRLILALSGIAWLLLATDLVRADMATGSGAFHMNDERGRLAAPMKVFYHRAETFRSHGPIIMVIHGMGRTAARYRDRWVDAADLHGALILAPEFSREHYPGSRQFNLGNMRHRNGSDRPRSEWSFPVIDRVFLTARKKFLAWRNRYHLFGHSAGAQFVHRKILFAPSKYIDQAVAANAGWYTMPVTREDFPYGLGGLSPESVRLKQALGRRLTIMLGTDDSDPDHRSLRRTQEALRQGPHRLARGHHFFKAAVEQAKRLEISLAWTLREVPGVAHSGRQMSAAAARYLFEQ